MNFMKVVMGISLIVTFDLVACGDDSSSNVASSSEVKQCKVDSYNPLKMEMTADGAVSTVTIDWKDGNIITTEVTEYPNSTKAKEACAEEKAEAEDGNVVSCEGNTVTIVSSEAGDKEKFMMAAETSMSKCEKMNSTESDDSYNIVGSHYVNEKCNFKKDDDVWKYVRNGKGERYIFKDDEVTISYFFLLGEDDDLSMVVFYEEVLKGAAADRDSLYRQVSKICDELK